MSCYIIKHKRTPILSYLKNSQTVIDLALPIVKDITKNINKDDITMCYIGNVLSAGNGQNIARQIAYKCGIKCPSITLNRVCSSGMQAIIEGYKSIVLGDYDLILVGGVESMSNSPHLIYNKKQTKYGDIIIKDSMLVDGLIDSFSNELMVKQAENILKKYNLTRAELDNSAKHSYLKSRAAVSQNDFKDEILPININNIIIDEDQEINKISNLEKIYTVKTIKEEGLLTPVTVAKLSDGASFFLLASEKYITKMKITPIAEIFGYNLYVDIPKNSPICFINCIKKLCNKYNITIEDIDSFEINEAFSFMSILANKILNIPLDNLNEYGSSISMGHPIGASGARIVNTLLSVLKNKSKTIGCATVCNGGGGASSILIKNLTS